MIESKYVSRKNEKGAVILLMAIAIVALIGVGSLAVDIGSALVTKAELQNVADASSLAAARELGIVYRVDHDTTGISAGERTQVAAKAAEYAEANKAAGVSISVLDGDVLIGPYAEDGTVTNQNKGARAVQVTARRDENANEAVSTALGQVLGINQIGVTATSAAALFAMGTLNPGEGEFPIGLDENWFDHNECVEPDGPPGKSRVKLYPTDETSCAGWHTFTTKPASSSQLKRILKKMSDGTFQSPETIANETYYEFIGGHIDSRMQDLEEYHNNVKGGEPWHTTVPIYQASGCANPNQARLIVGFARFEVQVVRANKANDPHDPLGKGQIWGQVECGIFTEGEIGSGNGNGGGDFGTLIENPGMIQ